MYRNMWCFSARCSTNCCDVWLSLSKHDNIRNTNGHEGYFSFLFSVFFFWPFRIDKVHFEFVLPFFFSFFFCFVSCISGVFDVRLLQMNEHWTKAGRFSRCFFCSVFAGVYFFYAYVSFQSLDVSLDSFFASARLLVYVCLRAMCCCCFFFSIFFSRFVLFVHK